MSFRASQGEFENRFWVIGGVFSIGFALYSVNHVNFVEGLGGLLLGAQTLNSPTGDFFIHAVFALAAVLVGVAAVLRSWATAYLQSTVVHDAARHSNKLVAEGPYRYVRNPLYLGNILMVLGMGTMASTAGFLFMVAGMTVVVYRLILFEEDGLVETQGESFRRYCDAVPRLFPAFSPRLPSGGAQPNWWDGITGESFMWGCAFGIAVFAITLQVIHFWIIVSVGFLIYFIQSFSRGRTAKAG